VSHARGAGRRAPASECEGGPAGRSPRKKDDTPGPRARGHERNELRQTVRRRFDRAGTARSGGENPTLVHSHVLKSMRHANRVNRKSRHFLGRSFDSNVALPKNPDGCGVFATTRNEPTKVH
jgi:hypothetical protein